MNVTLGASSFNQRNGNASLGEAKERASRIAIARPAKTTVTISVAFGCPSRAASSRPSSRASSSTSKARSQDRPRGHDRRRHAAPGARTRRADERGRLPRPQHSATPASRMPTQHSKPVHYTRRLGWRPRRVSVRTARDGEHRHRGPRLHARGRRVETGVDLDALIAIPEWLEGVLGRQLEARSTARAASRGRGVRPPD